MSELFANDELNRRILEVVPGGIIIISADGALTTANAEACRILGLTYDELTKSFVADFGSVSLHEDGSPMPPSEYTVSEVFRTGIAQPPKIIGVRHANGEIVWALFSAVPLYANGELTRAVVTCVDVTERKKVEALLRVSEARFRSIFDSAPNIIISTDENGLIEFINRHAPALQSPRDVLGASVLEFIPKEDRSRVSVVLDRVRATGQIDSYEINGIDGGRFSVHVGPIKDGENFTGFTFVAWDVTRQRDLEARLVVSDRMASVGQLAAGVAHEINNPLTYVLANLYGLFRALEQSEEPKYRALAERAAHAVEGAERIKSIVRDLSTFSHTEVDTAVLLDVRPMIESSIRMAQGQLRYRAKVVTHLQEVPPVLANDSRLGQVFLNLLVNAAQAIPEGHVDENAVTVSTHADEDGMVVIEIHDTGSGISQEIVKHIFNPFVTTKAQGEGTGLGLYICRNIVHSLGGEITVESRPGDTRFRVKLPAAASTWSARDAASKQAQEVELPFERRAILVIDDELQIRELVGVALSRHDVTKVASGREALDIIATRSFDVILCDLIMPDLTGMDVFERTCERAPDAVSKFIFMTGGAFTERARAFVASQGITILDKPFSTEKLRQIVARKRN